MNFNEMSKEQKIMVTMRKVLSNIIREITPKPGNKYPLSEQTVEDIRMCLALITTREQELAKEQGISNTSRPQYVDEAQATKTIPIDQIQGRKGKANL